MNVLITAGGTTEKIDSVRNISNISTGKLGSLLALNFSEQPAIKKIYYICSDTAIKPQCEKIEVIITNSVSNVEMVIQKLFKDVNIDIVVHSMAVSDYRIKSVTSANGEVLNRNNKIGSDIENIIIYMEKTPKIIKLFQSLSPESMLVGFKLLDNVTLETLINSGYKILTENKCGFVLANDLKDIKEGQHIGYLIDKNKNFNQYNSKQEIAEAIVSATIINSKRKNSL